MNRSVFAALMLIGSNAFAGSVVIAFAGGDTPVSSSIDVDADYVALSVTVTNDAKYASERASLIRQAQSTVERSVANTRGLSYRQGVISPSSYRAQLLEIIANEVEQYKAAFGQEFRKN